MLNKILVGNLEGKDQLEDLDVDGRLILRWTTKGGYELVNIIHVAQDRDRWWAFVNTVVNRRVL
jgi:hypothetical protein